MVLWNYRLYCFFGQNTIILKQYDILVRMEAVVSWLYKSCLTHLDKAVGKPQHVHDGHNALVEVEAVISCLHDSGQSLQPLLQFPKEKSIFVKKTKCGVADPDPYVFGPPGSGSTSISTRYRSGSDSGSFYHQAKIVRKTLIPSVLWLFMTF